jgi:hypothetical protein
MPDRPRTLSEDEVARILRLAGTLQESHSGGESDLTVPDLERAAAEAGIDPRYVRVASLIVSGGEEDWPGVHVILGTGPQLSLQRSIPKAVKRPNAEELAAVIEGSLGSIRQLDTAASALAWTSATSSRTTDVTLVFERDATRLMVSEDLTGLGRNLFTAMIAGVGVLGGGIAFAAVGAITGSPRASLVAAGCCLILSVVLARVMNRTLKTRRAARLTDLAERLLTRLYG